MGIKEGSNITKPVEKLYGPSATPTKYSSAGTRFASLHGLQQGAEFNEVNQTPTSMPGELPHDLGYSNIKSAATYRDLPSCYGLVSNRGMDKIGNTVFTPDWIRQGWKRIRGEPPS